MRKRITIFKKALLLGLFVFITSGIYSQGTKPSAGGDGTEQNPYQIETLDNLFWLSHNHSEWDKHYVQTADIDATPTIDWNNGLGFKPIGNATIKFTGSYNGNGHIISNLTINRPNTNHIGLFGVARDGALITNLGLTSLNVTGSSRVGGLIGTLGGDGTITNCYAAGTVFCANGYYSNGGGFAGVISGAVIACYASVDVSSEGNRIGGFVGQIGSTGSISNCYSTGNVSNNTGQSDGRVGGFVGDNYGTITNCYSTGKPSTSDSAIGGFNGYVAGTTINCYWDKQTSEITYTQGGGTGLTTEEMKNAFNFIAVDWDFAGETENGNNDFWGMNCSDNDGYAFLMWQGFIQDATIPTPNEAALDEIVADCEVQTLTPPTAIDQCDGEIAGVANTETPITHSTIITWEYRDTDGNITNQSQSVVINDVTAPVPNTETLPNITAECEVELTAPTATDNCSGQITGVPEPALPITETTVVTWTFTDDNGNSTTQTQNVIIEDNTPPAPDEATLADIETSCSVTELTAPTATDNCSGQIFGTHDATLPLTETGTTVITWTYTDNNGNSSTQTQNIVITADNTAPVPKALDDIIAQCAVTELTAPTATDNCDGEVEGTHNVTLPITEQGTTVITWTYTDNSGNSSTQTQNLTITADDTSPEPGMTILEDVHAQSMITVLAVPTATDNCDGQIEGTHDATLPLIEEGTTLVTWTFTDNSSNISTQTQNVIVNDNAAPIPDVATLPEITAHCEVTELTSPTATDNCDGQIEGTHDASLPITEQGITEVIWTFTDSDANSSTQIQNVVINNETPPVPDAESLTDITGQCEVTELTAPTATGYCGGQVIGTTETTLPITASTEVIWTYTDGNGNTTTQAQNVIIEDVTAPVPDAESLADVTAACEVTDLTVPTATDNCAGQITGVPDVTFPITASKVVTWSYIDGNGNTTTQSQNVTIEDDIAPVPDTETLSDLTEACAVSDLEFPTATDNCAGQITGVPNPELPITTSTVITWTYTDGNGNTTTQTQNVTILDDIAPVPDTETLADITVECEVTEFTAPTATDNCAGQITGVPDATLPIVTNTTVTWTYTDGNGNTTTQAQNITIEDNTLPTLTCAGYHELTGNQDGNYTIQGTEFDPTEVDDNCGVASIVNDFNNTETLAGELIPEGTTNIYWTVTDKMGNTNSCIVELVVTASETSIANLQQAGINLYPNPTSHSLTVELGENNVQRLTINDISGRVILTKENLNPTETLDVSSFSDGIYILNIKTKSEVISTRIVKQ